MLSRGNRGGTQLGGGRHRCVSHTPSTRVAAFGQTPTQTQAQGDATTSISGLADELRELRQVVEHQQRLIQQQQQELHEIKTSRRSPGLRSGAYAYEGGSVRSYDGTAASLRSFDGEQASTSGWDPQVRPFDQQRLAVHVDRRAMGLFDARFHSLSKGATPRDFRVLPERIILVRHAESMGNVAEDTYTQVPDSQVPLTDRGHEQAREAGRKIRAIVEGSPGRAAHPDYKLYFYTSPYMRSIQTYENMATAFDPERIVSVQEEVQLREQDFGNFQDPDVMARGKAERLRFCRFFYRFPNGESGADVYNRIRAFENHLIRDINAGRFGHNSNLVLVSHGLALRVFLMSWFHWTVDDYLCVHNPGNAQPLVLERIPQRESEDETAWQHTKALYRLKNHEQVLKGCTDEMCQTGLLPRTISKISTRNFSSS